MNIHGNIISNTNEYTNKTSLRDAGYAFWQTRSGPINSSPTESWARNFLKTHFLKIQFWKYTFRKYTFTKNMHFHKKYTFGK